MQMQAQVRDHQAHCDASGTGVVWVTPSYHKAQSASTGPCPTTQACASACGCDTLHVVDTGCSSQAAHVFSVLHSIS